MSFYLNKNNYQAYFLGSLFFGTGGGLPFEKNCALAAELLSGKKQIEIRPMEDFRDTGIIVSAYGVGDPNQADIDFAKAFRQAYKKYQELSGQIITGIIPGEIGGEIMAFQAAKVLRLPVVDADLVGGRAAPEIQLDAFTVFGLSLTPLLGMAGNGKCLFFSGAFSAQEIERQLRPFFSENGGSGVLIGYPAKAGILKKFIISGTLSQTFALGNLLQKNRVDPALKIIKGKTAAQAKIIGTTLQSQDGFFQGDIIFDKYKIQVKNENMRLCKNGKLIASAPDIIMLIDKNSRPIHNTDIKKYTGKPVRIITAPAQGYWKIRKNRRLWQ